MVPKKRTGLKKILRSVLRILVPVYVLLCVWVYTMLDDMIYYPVKLDDNSAIVKVYKQYEIMIESDGVELYGWFINRGMEKLIIYYGGNGEDISMGINEFKYNLKAFDQYSILLMNYRGYGKSHGEPSQDNLYNDAINVFDHICGEMKISPENVTVFGRSLGSSVAVYVASKREVGKVVLVTPFDSIRNLAKRSLPFLPMRLLVREPYDSSAYAREVEVPSLILIGGQDNMIPLKNSMNLAKSWGGEAKTRVIKNGNHNDIHIFDEYWEAVNEYIGD